MDTRNLAALSSNSGDRGGGICTSKRCDCFLGIVCMFPISPLPMLLHTICTIQWQHVGEREEAEFFCSMSKICCWLRQQRYLPQKILMPPQGMLIFSTVKKMAAKPIHPALRRISLCDSSAQPTENNNETCTKLLEKSSLSPPTCRNGCQGFPEHLQNQLAITSFFFPC